VRSHTSNPVQANKWIIAITVMFPTFIEIMDTSVVNVSLPHIQGSLNAGLDEVTWVLTSYLVSNAIVIPISGWLASLLGRRRYLMISLLIFTGSSVACGLAPSLGLLVVFRIFQGMGGGGLQPLSQAILLETFPKEEHGMAMAFFGMGVVFAPILGPVVGGWLTDQESWRWIFYINLPAGLLASFLILAFIHDPAYIRKKSLRIDRWGLFFLCIGLGCLQIVLDKGQREDWFHSPFILYLSILSVLSMALFVWTELRTPNPVVDLRVLRDRTFTTGSGIMFAGFLSLFASLVLLPLYVQNLMGYTAFWAGLVLGPGGMTAFMIMPVAGLLMRKGINSRNLLAVGLTIMAYAIWQMSRFNLQADAYAIIWPRVVMGVGMGLFFVPLSASTFVTIPNEKTGNASGIFNLLRNLGGSFGVAIGTTVLARRAQVHQNFLVEAFTPFSSAFHQYHEFIRHFLENRYTWATQDSVYALIYQDVIRHATMLAFNDAFWGLAWLTAGLVPLTFLLKQGKKTEGVRVLH
jgi:DHA2 family multidrug resistance protein